MGVKGGIVRVKKNKKTYHIEFDGKSIPLRGWGISLGTTLVGVFLKSSKVYVILPKRNQTYSPKILNGRMDITWHFLLKHYSWGCQASIIKRLKKLGCKKVRQYVWYIYEKKDGDIEGEKIISTDFNNFYESSPIDEGYGLQNIVHDKKWKIKKDIRKTGQIKLSVAKKKNTGTRIKEWLTS